MTTAKTSKVVADEASKDAENLVLTTNKQLFDSWELAVRSGQQLAESSIKIWFKGVSTLLPK